MQNIKNILSKKIYDSFKQSSKISINDNNFFNLTSLFNHEFDYNLTSCINL